MIIPYVKLHGEHGKTSFIKIGPAIVEIFKKVTFGPKIFSKNSPNKNLNRYIKLIVPYVKLCGEHVKTSSIKIGEVALELLKKYKKFPIKLN